MARETVHLSELEAAALAYRIVGLHVKDTEGWLEWEDFGWLGEASFRMVEEKVKEIARTTLERSDSLDVEADVDSRLLYERAAG
jgi:hypothetical protein